MRSDRSRVFTKAASDGRWRLSCAARSDQPCLLCCALDLDCFFAFLSCLLAVHSARSLAALRAVGGTCKLASYRVRSRPLFLNSCRHAFLQLPCSVLLLLAGGVLARAEQACPSADMDVILMLEVHLVLAFPGVCCRSGRFARDVAAERHFL